MNRFEIDEVDGWLRRNRLLASSDCFAQGLDVLSEHRRCSEAGPAHVLLHPSNPDSWMGGAFASICAGASLWFVPPNWSNAQLEILRSRFSPDFILSDAGWQNTRETPAVNGGGGERAWLSELGQKIMIPTGGSSGNTRFAVHDLHTHTAAVHGVARQFLGRSCRTGDFNYCSDLPLWHVSGWMQVVRAFLSDSSFFTGLHAREDWKAQLSGRWISVVPTQLKRMLEDAVGRAVLQQADVVIVGGGPCPESVLHESLRKGVHPWVTYGMTETLGMIAGKQLLDEQDFPRAAEVFPHASIAIEGRNGSNQSAGEKGEIVVQSAALFRGYVPLSVREGALLFEPCRGKLHTRDLGSMDERGGLHVWGRMDDLILTGGEKVNPLEVENEIRKFPGIEDCLVGSLPDGEWGQRVVCLFTAGVGLTIDTSGLVQFLKMRLESFKIPKNWARVESLPYDAKGKIDKSRLRIRILEVFAN